MRYRLRTLLIVLAVGAVVGCLVVPIAVFHLTPPDFVAEAVAKADGTWILYVHPNFVVNSIRSIKVEMGNTTVVRKQGVFRDTVTVELPAKCVTGARVAVECDLAYDRIMPSIESVQHHVTLR